MAPRQETPSPSELEQETVTLDGAGPGGGDLRVNVPAGGAEIFGSNGPTSADAAERHRQRNAAREPLLRRYLADILGGNFTADVDPETGTRAAEGVPMVGGLPGTSTAGGTLDSLLVAFTSMTEAQISYLQRRLFQAGFYASAIYDNVTSIQWGMIDQATQAALMAAIDKAAVNQVDNFDQFLENERYRFGRDGIAGDGQEVTGAARRRGEETPVIDIVLSDPDTVRLLAESTAVELLGRKPTEQELSRITATLHARQRESQTARQQPVGDAAGTPADPTEGGVTLLQGERNFGLPPGTGQTPALDAEQLGVVNTIIQVGTQMGLSEEYIVAAISAGLVESGLRNLNHGDRDSLGVFQQRPSQGWGSPSQVRDVAYASRKFFEALLQAEGSDLGELVANTQRPAKQYRGRYADVMDEAVDVYRAVTGQAYRSTEQQTAPGGGNPISAGINRVVGAIGGAPAAPTSIRQAERAGSPVNPIQAGVNRVLDVARGRGGGIPRDEQDISDAALWFNSLMGTSSPDPIIRESTQVDPQTLIEMELRRANPTEYETHQAALKAVEFFALLGSGGGLTDA